VDENLVIFAGSNGADLPFNMMFMYDEAQIRNYKIHLHFYDSQTGSFIKNFQAMCKFMYWYARARYVFIDNYFIPASSCKKRPETFLVQLWHASGSLKKFGFDSSEDIPSFYIGNPAKNYDLVTTSAPLCSKHYSTAFQVPIEICKTTGISRTDYFFNQNYVDGAKDSFYNRYPEYINKKILLWAPTFRGNAAHPEIVGIDTIVNLKLNPEWVVLAKLHPLAAKKYSIPQPEFSTEILMIVADLLITDYSTVLFEFALLRKPIILYVPDYNTYRENRGLYYDLEDLTLPTVQDEASLMNAIIKLEEDFKPADLESMIHTHMLFCDGNATNRICNEIGFRQTDTSTYSMPASIVNQ